jgi:hypothetical protein
MNITTIGLTIDTIGKLMVSYTAIKVHHRFWQEHKIDEKVFQTMQSEQVIGIIGMLFMVIGYFLQVV